MRKLMLLVLILLVHKSTQHDNDSSPVSANCGDCSDIKSQRFTSIGHICHQEDKTALKKNYAQEYSPYPDCVPNIYELTRPVKRYCCFWSPQLGCSMLVGEKHYNVHELRCTPCKAYCEPTENGVGRTNYGNLGTTALPLLFLALKKMLRPLRYML